MVDLVTSEFGEGLVHLVRDGLVLLLLVSKIVFETVDLLLQLDHCSFRELGASLSLNDN